MLDSNHRHAQGDVEVMLGSTVEVRYLDSNEVEVYTLVHPEDADIKNNRISSFTPAGHALYGKRVGDVVEIAGPGGSVEVRIESIQQADGAPTGKEDVGSN